MALTKARLLKHSFPVHGLKTLVKGVLLHDERPKKSTQTFFEKLSEFVLAHKYLIH